MFLLWGITPIPRFGMACAFIGLLWRFPTIQISCLGIILWRFWYRSLLLFFCLFWRFYAIWFCWRFWHRSLLLVICLFWRFHAVWPFPFRTLYCCFWFRDLLPCPALLLWFWGWLRFFRLTCLVPIWLCWQFLFLFHLFRALWRCGRLWRIWPL